jgi:hypothetical protein
LSATPFEGIHSDDRFFAGSVEYERLPATAAERGGGEQEDGSGEGGGGGEDLAGSPATPFDAQMAFITNMFDPHDTCNVCMTGPGVRRDHPDPIRAIHLTKRESVYRRK